MPAPPRPASRRLVQNADGSTMTSMENGFVLTRNGNRDDVERGCGGSCAVRGGTLQPRRRFLPACP